MQLPDSLSNVGSWKIGSRSLLPENRNNSQDQINMTQQIALINIVFDYSYFGYLETNWVSRV